MKLLPTYYLKKIVLSKTPSEFIGNSGHLVQYWFNQMHYNAQQANQVLSRFVTVKQ